MGFGDVCAKGGKISALLIAGFALSACEDGFQGLNLGKGKKAAATETEATPGSGAPIKLVERDVEAPEVFEKNEKALWDGRPSLGGVWVAHPDSKQPERVIIRNEANNKFVVGALFRRERDNPGPSLQLSSDAAAALGVQAGTPSVLRVTALRRETVNVNEEEPIKANAPDDVATTELKEADELAAAVTAAIGESEKKPTPKPVAAPAAKKGAKFAQIGFFSQEANAKANVSKMKKNGIPAKIVKSTTNGKTFWRVLAGPANSGSEQRQLLNMVKSQGYSDAYLVSG